MKYIVAAAILVCLTARTAYSASITDAFSSYLTGSAGAPNWDTDGVDWTTASGAMTASSADRTFAVDERSPRSEDVDVKATVTIDKSTGTDWKVAGIALYDGDQDYWHLALVESPDPKKVHSIELAECYGGDWLAQAHAPTALTRVKGSGGGPWVDGQGYRLHLQLSPSQIEGVVTDEDGSLVADIAYRLDNKAVNAGRPGLDCGGFDAHFTQYSAETNAPVPDRPAPTGSPYTAKGYAGVTDVATGFFHVVTQNGRSWLVDPLGHGFYAVGTDHANYNVHWCEALGYAPYHRNCVAKFHGDEEAWGKSTANRLKSWNFNALGLNASKTVKNEGLPREEIIDFGTQFAAFDPIADKDYWTGFPDVFSPRWPAFCNHLAREFCRPLQNDPWLIGYFSDNELEWFGKDHAQWGLFDECMKRPAGNPAKEAAVAFLQQRYATIDALNDAWGAHFISWDSMAAGQDVPTASTKRADVDRLAFIGEIADRYFRTTRGAIRAADPNHMDLGCRFAGFAPDAALISAGQNCDVVTVNYYGNVDLDKGVSVDMPSTYERYHTLCGKPMMITEWSFVAYDSGLPCRHGAGQRVQNQSERAKCFGIYQAATARLPFMVGSNFFMWADEPAQGISHTFPEDSNYGLVDVNDNAWTKLTAAATGVNKEIYEIHAGHMPEVAVNLAAGRPTVWVSNTGNATANFILHLWVDGVDRPIPIHLAPGARRTIDLPVFRKMGAHLVTAIADPESRLPPIDRSSLSASQVYYGPGHPRSMPDMLVISNQSERSSPACTVTVNETDIGAWVLVDGSGVRVQVQLVASFSPDEEYDVIPVPSLPAHTCRTLYYADQGPFHQALHGKPFVDTYNLGGSDLTLNHTAGSSDFFSAITTADGVPLGAFGALIEQYKHYWVAPTKISAEVAYNGSIPNTIYFTGTYTPPTPSPHGPYAYKATYEIATAAGKPWFTSRLISIKNTSPYKWNLAAYYHYAKSSIAGSNADTPLAAAPDGTAVWENATAGAYYGAVEFHKGDFKMSYWRDDAGNEHPDVWRDVDVDLAPGQTYDVPQPAVAIFGLTDDASQLASLAATVQAEGRLQVTFHKLKN